MLNQLHRLVLSPWYWLAIVLVGLGLEGVALFYQHVLGEPPCVLCIHARVWTLGGIIAGSVGLILHRLHWARLVAQLGVVISIAGLMERSYRAMQVERGTYEGVCGFDPGFPSWMPLDVWFPNVFEVWTMCGYSPNFILGLTMVEGLTYGSGVLLAIALVALVVLMRRRR
ncbi:disulfide bond formation protein B [Saccharospirillum sp.]|uniref:disulfide bond formation protein B n=1 Tax=Saccharospirillum sp. TaxID=2033801 RepID=UPI0034A08B72